MAEIQKLTLHPSGSSPEQDTPGLIAEARLNFHPEETALGLRYRLHLFLLDSSLKGIPQIRGQWKEALVCDGNNGRRLPHLCYVSRDVFPEREKVVVRCRLPEVGLPAGVRLMGMLVSCLTPDQCISQPYFRKMRLI